MYLINHASFHQILDFEKRSKEAERMQQKNQAPMSEEEQEGEVINRRNTEEIGLFPIPPFLLSSSPPNSTVRCHSLLGFLHCVQ